MKYITITRRVSMLAIVGLLPAALVASETKEQIAVEKEGIQLIRQVEEVGRDVRYDAGRLNSLAMNMQVSKWTHVHHLNEIKASVNDGLRPALARLIEIQAQLPAWKQQSIDSMIECAKTLAADTNAAILNKNDAGVTPPAANPEYKSLIKAISEHAEMLVKTADAAGTYAAAHLKAEEAGLKVPKK